MLSDLFGGSIGKATIENKVHDLAQRHLGIISKLSAVSPWNLQQFAAALAFIESKHPTAEGKWRALSGT